MIFTTGAFSYGLINSIGSGVINCEGFLSSYVGEVFKVSAEDSEASKLGIVVNLHRDKTLNLNVGALLGANSIRLSEGSKVYSLSSLGSISIGDFVIGSLLDPQGNPVINSRRVDAKYR